jgi:hypothetical protein
VPIDLNAILKNDFVFGQIMVNNKIYFKENVLLQV